MINNLAIGELQNERLFIPISLGNHYYSNIILKRINNEIIPYSKSAIIFICDKLRYYFYKGKIDIPEDKLNIKIAEEVGQFIRTLNNCGLFNSDRKGCPWLQN